MNEAISLAILSSVWNLSKAKRKKDLLSELHFLSGFNFGDELSDGKIQKESMWDFGVEYISVTNLINNIAFSYWSIT